MESTYKINTFFVLIRCRYVGYFCGYGCFCTSLNLLTPIDILRHWMIGNFK